MFGLFGNILFLILICRILTPIFTKKNIVLAIIYLVAWLVGDYILIPHVTYVLLIGLVMTSVKYKNKLKGGIENENCTNN